MLPLGDEDDNYIMKVWVGPKTDSCSEKGKSKEEKELILSGQKT
jgi:hypothetical protein